MGYSIGDRLSRQRIDIGATAIAAALMLNARIQVEPVVTPESDLYLNLESVWTEWRDWYQQNKLEGSPDLPVFDPPMP